MKKLFSMLFMLLLMAMLSGVAMADSMDKGSSIGPVWWVSFDVDPTDIAPAGVATVPKTILDGDFLTENEWGDKCFSLDTMRLSSLSTLPGIDYLPDISGSQRRQDEKGLQA